jgi:hypothetical protein
MCENRIQGWSMLQSRIGYSWAAPVTGILLVFLSSISLADKVYLTNGQCVEGAVIEESSGEVKVRLASGITMGIPRVQVERVELDAPPEPTPTPPMYQGMPVRIMEVAKPEEEKGPTQPPGPEPPPEKKDPINLLSVVGGDSAPVPAEATGEKIGVCQKIVGQVQVRRPDGTWKDLKAGEVIHKGQVFRSLRGRARLLLTDGTAIGITENSEGRVQNEPGSRFELFRGRIWSQIKEYSRLGEIKLEIKSPNAVAAVRGGLLRFEVTPQQVARITLFEGDAAVEEVAGPPARLSPLQVAVVDADGSFAGFEDAAPEERREWDEWDQWAEEIIRDTRHLGFGVGGDIIGNMARQIADEQKLFKKMVDEGNRQVILNKEAEKLESYGEAVKRYFADVGHFPAEDKVWQRLKYNLGEPGWNGPYLASGVMLPLKDRWGNEIHYFIRTSDQGTEHVEIISNGPNGVFEDGKPDLDIKVILHVPQ